jgi:hypothetical protein
MGCKFAQMPFQRFDFLFQTRSHHFTLSLVDQCEDFIRIVGASVMTLVRIARRRATASARCSGVSQGETTAGTACATRCARAV